MVASVLYTGKSNLAIDKKVNEELEIYVGDIKKFEALPGYSNNKYAVRITEIIREESE